jgi:hypothetical protein
MIEIEKSRVAAQAPTFFAKFSSKHGFSFDEIVDAELAVTTGQRLGS